MKLKIFSSPSLIGIDVQPQGLRIVHLKHLKSSYVIDYAFIQSLPTDLFADGKIKRWDVLQAILTDIVQKEKLEKNAAAICLPANLVRMQQIEVPTELPEADMAAEIFAHMQREFPGMAEELSIDFTLSKSKHNLKTNLFFAAARKEYLMNYVHCVTGANLKLKIADVDVYALLRIILFDRRFETHVGTSAIIYVNHHSALFILYHVNEIVFHQSWEIMGETNFAAQIKQRIQFFLAGFQHLVIQRVIFCDVSCQFSELLEYFKTAWCAQVYVLDAISQFNYGSNIFHERMHQNSVEFLFACGLALHKVPEW